MKNLALMALVFATACRHYNDKYETETLADEQTQTSSASAPVKETCEPIDFLAGEPVDRTALMAKNICPPLKSALEYNLLLSQSEAYQLTDLPGAKPLENMLLIDLLCADRRCTDILIRWAEQDVGVLKASDDKQSNTFNVLLAKLSLLRQNEKVAVRIDNRVAAKQATGLIRLLGRRMSVVWLVGQKLVLPGGVKRLGETRTAIPTGVAIKIDASEQQPRYRPWQTWADGPLKLFAQGQSDLRTYGAQLTGAKVTLQNERLVINDKVYFQTGSATIAPKSYPLLNEVAKTINFLSAKVAIVGHTDNQGNPASNLALSRQRANAVRRYLTSKGVKGASLTATGVGSNQPVTFEGKPEGWDDTPAGREENRRVEFKVLSVKLPDGDGDSAPPPAAP